MRTNKGNLKKITVKGISLIVLVISIIIMIVLATTVVLSITNSGILEQANTAVNENNVSNAKEELQTSYANWIATNNTEKITTQKARELVDLKKYGMEKEYTIRVENNVAKIVKANPYYDKTAVNTYNVGEAGSNVEAKVYLNSNEAHDLVISGNGAITTPCATLGGYTLENVYILDGITSLCDSFMKDDENIKYVEMADSVVDAGAESFYQCLKLEKVVLSNNITEIGDYLFWCCWKLKKIDFSDNLEAIGEEAFKSCDLSGEIILPSKIKKISDSAFDSNHNLKKIIIPEGVTEIGRCAFFKCNNLITVIIPSSVMNIGSQAFDRTPWLIQKQVQDPIVIVHNLIIDGQTYTGTNLVIPEGVVTIARQAFLGNATITSVKIPDSVTYVGAATFGNCSKLTIIQCEASQEAITQNWDKDWKYNTNATVEYNVEM